MSKYGSQHIRVNVYHIIPGSFVKMADHGPQNIRRQLLGCHELNPRVNTDYKALIREGFVPYQHKGTQPYSTRCHHGLPCSPDVSIPNELFDADT